MLEVIPLRNMGAEVRGVDLSRELPESIRNELRELWGRYGVLVFKGAGHSHTEQLRLSHVFGPPEFHPLESLKVKGEPELVQVSGEGDHMGPAHVVGGRIVCGWLFWHQDQSYTTNIPQGSLLRMVRIPDSGGETAFVNISQAYTDLPESTRAEIDDLEARHTLQSLAPEVRFGMKTFSDVRLAERDEYDWGCAVRQTHFPVIIHRLVVTHPLTNQKCMLLSPLSLLGIVGMEEEKSDALLHALTDHVLQEKYMYVHKWEENDMILWDNWMAMHRGCGYPPNQHRLGYRTTIKGPTAFRTGRVDESRPLHAFHAANN